MIEAKDVKMGQHFWYDNNNCFRIIPYVDDIPKDVIVAVNMTHPEAVWFVKNDQDVFI